MFRQRQKPHPLRRLREFVWPRAGWRRSSRYVAHRIGRLRASPHAVAAGVAAGVAVSFLPLNGAHFVLAAALALATRGSVVASAIGTAAGNPWTFPAIWVGSYELGLWILGDAGSMPRLGVGAFVHLFGNLVRSALTADVDLFMQAVWPFWMPMMVGGVPLGALAGAISYVAIRRLVERVRARRAGRTILEALRLPLDLPAAGTSMLDPGRTDARGQHMDGERRAGGSPPEAPHGRGTADTAP
jgi:uncharacterized protein